MSDKIDIESILTNGIDLKNRRIYFGSLLESLDENGSDFTWRSVEWAVRAMHIMQDEDPKKPIEIHMSSPGGDAYALLRLYDVIQSSPCQIKFYGSGEICSAATWIMACCDERYLYPNTRVLVHDSSAGIVEVPEKLSDRYVGTDQERDLQDLLNRLYADNSRMPVEFWEEMVKRDLWLSAEETVALGLADKIIEPKKRGNLRRVRISNLSSPPDRKEFNKLLNKLKERVYMGRHVKLELHIPVEEFDKNVDIEVAPTVD